MVSICSLFLSLTAFSLTLTSQGWMQQWQHRCGDQAPTPNLSTDGQRHAGKGVRKVIKWLVSAYSASLSLSPFCLDSLDGIESVICYSQFSWLSVPKNWPMSCSARTSGTHISENGTLRNVGGFLTHLYITRCRKLLFYNDSETIPSLRLLGDRSQKACQVGMQKRQEAPAQTSTCQEGGVWGAGNGIAFFW